MRHTTTITARHSAQPATAPMPAVLGMPRTEAYADLGADCFADVASAAQFGGRRPVVAHPPRHAFGRFNPLGRVSSRDQQLTLWMLDQVRTWGGVLEHPANSRLWADVGLPVPGDKRDPIGGWTLPVWQSWWGGTRPRPTWLYVVGYDQPHMPPMPLALSRLPAEDAEPDHSALPPAFAAWLVRLAIVIGHAQAWRYRERGAH